MDHGRVELGREQGLDAFTGGLLDEHEQINVRRGPWLDESALGACPTLTVLLRRIMHRHLLCSRPRKTLNVSTVYASGFSGPAASHLAAPPSPRHEGNVGQAPRPSPG